MKLYVVHMYRWGDTELHSYIEGVYDSLEEARLAGINEALWRDKKYEPKICIHELNESKNCMESSDFEDPTLIKSLHGEFYGDK